jgi:hypothetical protein
MTPVMLVDRLLPPTVSSFWPSLKKPPPLSEPALSLLSLRSPVDWLKSVRPEAPLVMAALPAVLVLLKNRALLLVMVALPAVLLSRKPMTALLVMPALPAVLPSLKLITPPLLLRCRPSPCRSMQKRRCW